MRRLPFFIITALIALPLFAAAQSQGIQQLNQWKTTNAAYLQPISNAYGLKVPGLATSTTGCLSVNSIGWISANGSACGSGGGGTFAWTPTSYGNATSTTLGLLNGFTTPASSTIAGAFHLGLSAGFLYVGSGSTVQSAATTSASCAGTLSCSAFTVIGTSPVTLTGSAGTSASSTLLGDTNTFSGTDIFSNTIKVGSLGGLIGGNGGTLYAFASSSLFGYTPEQQLTFTWPLIRTANALTFGGLSTSSPIAAGAAVLYATGVNTIASAATGTISGSTGLSVTAGQSIIGTGLTITNTGVTSNVAGNGIAVSGSTGAVTITNTIGYPFPNNATTTAIGFTTGGMFTNGSTTITSVGSGLVGANNGLLYGFASSSLFGYTPLNPTRNINTTAPITGGGDLSADRTIACASCDTFGNAFTYVQATANNYLIPTTTTVGIIIAASSTIGNGNQNGGLTISGGSTTTLNAYFASKVGIGTTSPTANLSVAGCITNTPCLLVSGAPGQNGEIWFEQQGQAIGKLKAQDNQLRWTLNKPLLFDNGDAGDLIGAIIPSTHSFGLGTSTPYAQLSVGGGNLVVGAATAGGTIGDLFLPKLGVAAGTFLAADATGKVIATTSPAAGSRGTTALSQEVPFSNCAPEATSTRFYIGGAFFQPVGISNLAQFTPMVMTFGFATSSAMNCIINIPDNYVSGGSLQLTYTSTSTSGVGVVDVEATDTPQQAGIYNNTVTFNQTWAASTTAGKRITIPATAGVSTTSVIDITGVPNLTAGDNLLVRITRWGKDAADTAAADINVMKVRLKYTGN